MYMPRAPQDAGSTRWKRRLSLQENKGIVSATVDDKVKREAKEVKV